MRFIVGELSWAVSLELQNLLHALSISQESLARILTYLDYADLSALNQDLEQSAVTRRSSDTAYLYVLQQSQQIPSISYAISPLLCSVLNHHTYYVAQAETWLTDFYQQYFRIDALETAKVASMQSMQICLDLQSNVLNPKEFYIASLLQALLDSKAKMLVTLGSQQLIAEIKQQLMAYYSVNIIEIQHVFSSIQLTPAELKKLFWKRKDDTVAQASQQIAYDNSRLVAKLCNLSRTDAERFIEDLMYGEHVFEKVSVLGEFSDTIYKHEHEKLHKLIA